MFVCMYIPMYLGKLRVTLFTFKIPADQLLYKLCDTVGLINFEDKNFRGFHGYLLNLKIKYPRNFLHTRSRFFV